MWRYHLDNANNFQQEYGVERRWNPYVLECPYESIARTSWLKVSPGKSKMELKVSEISTSSEIPTYNIQRPIRADTYIILVAK